MKRKLEFEYDLEDEGVMITHRELGDIYLNGDDVASFLECIGRDRIAKIKENNKHVADALSCLTGNKRCPECNGTGIIASNVH